MHGRARSLILCLAAVVVATLATAPANAAATKSTTSKSTTTAAKSNGSTPAAATASPAATTPAAGAMTTSPPAGGAKAMPARDAKGRFVKAAPASSGQVWVNLDSKIYFKSGDRWYGKTKHGQYMSEAEAIKAGYRVSKAATK